MFGARILILVPHPDDEVVACAAAIGRANKDGAKIYALYLTHGCIAKETLWPWQRRRYESKVNRRRKEAEIVADLLGLTPIGFSDRPARHLWRNLPDVAAEIRRVVHKYNIDQLWIPAYEGGNADHDGLNGLCGTLRSSLPPILEFAEYNYADGKAHSQSFPSKNGGEAFLLLTAEEQTLKQKALALYKSEKQNLNYIQTHHETLRPLAAHDYSKPPHEGTAWYARFHWVPFRHPRVDFTKPEDVCEAISAFARASGLPESAKR